MTLYKKQIREVKKTVEMMRGIPQVLAQTDWVDEDNYKPTLEAGNWEEVEVEERFVKVEA